MAVYSSMFKRLNNKSFRLIKPLLHSYLDYAAIVIFLLLPFIIKLPTESVIISVSWAIIHLAISVFSDYPGGLIKSFLFSAHGWVEFAGGVVLVFFPWFTEHLTTDTEKIYFTAAGLFLLTLWMLSDYSNRTADEYSN